MVKIKLSSKEWHDHLMNFSEKVTINKAFHKLNYDDWRHLRSFDSEDILLAYDETNYLIDVMNYNTGNHIFSLTSKDSSFGEYLYNYIIYSTICLATLKEDNKQNIDSEKENVIMKGLNFDFGPCTGDRVRISMYGIAIQNVSGTWVSYDPKSESVIDVDIFNFADAAKYMFKMPVAIKDIAVGDVIVHNKVPVFVTDVTDGNITVIDIRAGEKKEIIPTKSMFGFDFVTKVVSLFNAVGAAPTPDQPFGNMLPFLMLNGENGKDIDPMMLMLMMQNQGGDASTLFNNPMMLYCMMKNEDNDILPMMFLMNQK